MFLLCTKENIEVICDKILKSEISAIKINLVDNNYMMEIKLNETQTKYNTKVLAKLFSEIKAFYINLVFEKVEYFELNYDLDKEQYILFDSYAGDSDEDFIAKNEKAKDYLRRSYELFNELGIDKLHLETLYYKDKNRYKNTSFMKALKELVEYI